MSLPKILAEHGFRCRKRWGQNFLVDENILRKITAAARLSPADIVVEIGAGTGVLTRALAQNAGLVVAVEIDRRLMPVLTENLKDFDNVELVFRDALALDFDALVKEKAAGRAGPPAAVPAYKVVANIPYAITTPLLLHLLRGKFHFSFLLLMVQQEVARRLVAGPKDGDYGAFSIVVQYYTEPKILFRVPRTVFYPRPEVDSAVVCLERRIKPAVEVPDEDLFFGLVRSAFGQRRKTILNALAGGPPTAAAPPGSARGLTRDAWRKILQAAGIDPGRRGESLGSEEFAALARQYAQSIAELVPNQPGKK
ncbi:MAG: 16S rRNA (adenine(1518)-N(6)/adenine(1519)-N(6))-dimethyltransferase RsmA [Armatimonadetes bacterium]|nr:16S rRNA (adenine(1518)-N(6)/adenine(1519)-N(6))-dimethyltransferase RsmA [Armatimonadota bacterium]